MKILVLQCRSIASELGRYRRLVAAVVTDRSVVEALRLVLLLECGCWRWWLANLGPTTESCVAAALRIVEGSISAWACDRWLWSLAVIGVEDDTGGGAAFAAVNPNRCWLWWVLWVAASGLMMETMNSDFEQWTVGSCNQNSKFLNREFFYFFVFRTVGFFF
jgi:hypothetical protein